MIRSTALLVALSLAATGCATYPERTSGAYSAFRSGHLAYAVQSYGDADYTGSEFLAGAESGTVALTAGDWDGAVTGFERAVRVVDMLEREALLNVTNATEQVGAWVLNDGSIEYSGEGFERVYLHSGLALAYLAQGRLESVQVETRRSNAVLEREEELYEKSYRAGGLGHFLSALAYELGGEPGEAYIDYRRMVEKGVGVELAGRSLVRLAGQLGYDDELPALVDAHGPDYPRPDGFATIVVVGGVGLGPVKVEGRLDVPTGDGVFSWTVPETHRLPQPVSGLELRVGSVSARTAVLEDVAAVASANLSDRLAWLAAKSAARGVLKLGITRKLESEGGAAGLVLGSLYSIFSERADLRAWQSLPDSWQAARVFVPSGVHSLELAALGGDKIDLGTYEVLPGETMIIFARSVERALYAYPIGGLAVDQAAKSWPVEPPTAPLTPSQTP